MIMYGRMREKSSRAPHEYLMHEAFFSCNIDTDALSRLIRHYAAISYYSLIIYEFI